MKKAPGAVRSADAQKARALGAAMGEVVRRERERNQRQFRLLWVGVVIAILLALL